MTRTIACPRCRGPMVCWTIPEEARGPIAERCECQSCGLERELDEKGKDLPRDLIDGDDNDERRARAIERDARERDPREE